nr:YaaR family protein [Paenibacillus sp. Marseille-Q4541]
MQSGISPTDTGAKPIQTKDFAGMMQQQGERASDAELTRRLNEIQLQGDRLARSMTIRELKAYKQLVKRFLEDTVRRGVSMKESKGWDRRGRGKRYLLIDEVDAALLQMAEDLLQLEQGKMELLQKIGEIRGMLINLSF